MHDPTPDAPTILLMGFRPSTDPDGDRSGEIVAKLAAQAPRKTSLRPLLLPPERDDALVKAIETMDHFLPGAVLLIGTADEHTSLLVERAAANLDEPRSESRGGAERIDAAGPAAYFSTLPVDAMVARIRAGGVPAQAVASSSGASCNRLHYALLHYVALRGRETWFKKQPPAGLASRVGAIRIPAGASLPLETSLRGVRLALAAVSDYLASPEGRTASPFPAVD